MAADYEDCPTADAGSDAALRARRVRHVRGTHDQRAADHDRQARDRQRPGRLGRDVPARADLPARARGRCPGRDRELAPALLGVDPRNLRGQGRAGRRAARPRLRQGRARHRLLGPARPRAGVPVSDAAGRRHQRATSRSTSRSRSARWSRWSRTCATAAPRASAASSSSSAPIRARTPRACARCSRPPSAATSIIADANGGWRLQDAMIAARALEGLDRVLSSSLPDARGVPARARAHDAADGPRRGDHRRPALLRAANRRDGGVNLKIGRVGGLTKARLMRDLGQRLGLRSRSRTAGAGTSPPPPSATSPPARRPRRC